MTIRFGIITLSDRSARGEREDQLAGSGSAAVGREPQERRVGGRERERETADGDARLEAQRSGLRETAPDRGAAQ